MKQNLPKYGVCTGKQRIVMPLVLGYLQKKVMTKLSKNCKKNLFSQHFRAQVKILFWEIHINNLFSLPDFYYCTKFQKKNPNEWILRKIVTKGWMEGWIDPQDHTFRGSIIISYCSRSAILLNWCGKQTFFLLLPLCT